MALLSSARYTAPTWVAVEWECKDDAACLRRQRGEDPGRNALHSGSAELKRIRERAALAYASPARCAESAADVPALLALHAAAEARWNRLREHITQERAAQDEAAAEHAEYGRDDRSERAYGAVEALDRLLATMDRMEADR